MDLQKSDIILILDNSASILQYAEQYVNTINSIISTQKELSPNTNLTCATFNEHIKYLCVAKPISAIGEVKLSDLNPSGLTAMYDCVSSVISNMLAFFEKTRRVPPLVIILTDGDDTISKRLTVRQLAIQIALAKQQGWKFVFLGCTQRSVEIGWKIGCNVCVFYSTTEKSFNVIPKLLLEIRQNGVSKDSAVDIRNIEDALSKMSIN